MKKEYEDIIEVWLDVFRTLPKTIHMERRLYVDGVCRHITFTMLNVLVNKLSKKGYDMDMWDVSPLDENSVLFSIWLYKRRREE